MFNPKSFILCLTLNPSPFFSFGDSGGEANQKTGVMAVKLTTKQKKIT
jgi:hypothetical protein